MSETPVASARATLGKFLATRSTLVAMIIVVLGGLFLSAAHVHTHPQLSPVDELQHIDYLFSAPSIVREGARVGQDAMREQACRGLAAWPQTPPCETPVFDPDDFQEAGHNTAAVYTPLYYTITRAVAAPIQWVFGLDSLVTAARLVSGMWLAGGLAVTLLVARRFHAPLYPTAGLLLATAATPNVIVPSATVTPDAAALLVGAALVWSVLWWEDAPARRWWLPLLLSVAAVAIKALNILAVALIALYLVFRILQRYWWPLKDVGEGKPGELREGQRPSPTLWGSLGLGVLACIASLVVGLGWVLLSNASAIGATDGASMQQQAASFPLLPFVEHLGAFLNVFYSPGWYVSVPTFGPLVQNTLGIVVFAGTFAAAFFVKDVARRARALAVSTLALGVIGAPLIIAFSYVAQGAWVPIPGRYALTMIPPAITVVGAASVRRTGRHVLGWGGFAMYLVILVYLVTY